MRQPFSTRQWKHYEGYKYLAPWTNAVVLRFLIRKFTKGLSRSEYRSKNQIDDAARSVVANIEEGYKRATTGEYLRFLSFSQGSLEEVKGDIKRFHQDGFLKGCVRGDDKGDDKGEKGANCSLAGFGVNLEELKGKLKESKGEVPLDILYLPLKFLRGVDLTFEIFMELINKTDYLLRRLVSSLEKKLVNPGLLKKKYQQEAEDFETELKRIVEERKRQREVKGNELRE